MIIYILRLALFLISFYGLTIFIKDKLRIKKEFSYAFTMIILILVLFIASLLNILYVVSLLICFSGFINLIYKITKEKKKFFVFDYKLIIILLVVLYLTILGLNLKITSYDNFSHWALIVKQLFLYDSLPSFEYNIVDFTSYPPASALFIYYIGVIVGKTETTMIIGQLYLTFIFITPLMIFFKDNKKTINAIIFILFSLFIMISNIPLMDLMVDTVLGTLGITSCCVAYYYRNDLKKIFLLLTLISLLYIILKNMGLLFIVFNSILLLIVGIYNKQSKSGVKYCIFMILISFILFLLWHQHLKLVYPGNTGLTTKHSLSLVNFSRNISKNGIENSIAVALTYLTNFYNFKNNVILYYIIGINLFLIFSMIISKKYKIFLKIIIFVNILYFGYWICLGFIYILSMPYEEAIRLACYSRYMMSCIIILFGIVAIVIYNLNITNNLKYQAYNLLAILIIILCIYLNPLNSYKDLFNFKGNDASEVERMEKFTIDYPLEDYKDNDVYLYFSCNFKTYYYYILKYKYFSNNFNIECNDINLSSLKRGTIIITPDNTKKIKETKHIIKVKDRVYQIIK